MYIEYFGLTAPPFSIAPDPRYLYMSGRHQEALAHLLYGLQADGGFVLLTGEVGTGKTTVCRCLLEQVPEGTDVAIILNPKLTAQELLATICDEFGAGYPAGNTSRKVLTDALNAYLLEAHAGGRKAVLIIDEAQNLDPDVLEQLRLLTNLETNERKLLQIVMVGQPELRDMLSRQDLRQLAQRITARFHLSPLTQEEITAYIRHRLSVAGAPHKLFTPGAVRRVCALSGGIPRLINVICDRALLGAYVQEQDRVDKATLEKAAREVLGEERPKAGLWGRRLALSAVALALLALLAGGAASLFWGPWWTRLAPSEAPTEPAPAANATAGPAAAAPGANATIQAATPGEPAVQPAIPAPAGAAMAQSQELAYRAVFAAWGVDYDPTRDGLPCAFAEGRGLGCLQLEGNLRSVLDLGRPAVLTFHDAKGEKFYAALTGFNGAEATFSVAGNETAAPVNEALFRWFGPYTVVFFMPPGHVSVIRQGDRGPAVLWLRQQLDRIDGSAPTTQEAEVFGEALAARVKRFQFSAGLDPDGVVGPQTLIRLNTAAGAGVPNLKPTKGDR